MRYPTSNTIQIKRGVRQGSVLSPLLFNLYSEAIFQEALEDAEMGIEVNGVSIKHFRYAEDVVLIADNIDDQQQMANMVGDHSRSMGLNINTRKTKFMVISRNLNTFVNSGITFEAAPIESVDKFKYLGTWVFEAWKSNKEIKSRIELAQQAFLRFNRNRSRLIVIVY